MITLRIEEILKERGITKTQFADMMGVAKQNVNLLLNTNNTQKMEKIAEVLGVKFTDLFAADDQPQDELNGFVEYKGEIHRIKDILEFEFIFLDKLFNVGAVPDLLYKIFGKSHTQLLHTFGINSSL